MFSQLFDILQHLIDPVHFMLVSTTFIPGTVVSLIRTRQFSSLLSPSAFKDAWFARFWGSFGPGSRERASENAKPLIQRAHGSVIEVGSGNGEWVHLYDKTKVTKIYGVEPNKDHHDMLRRRVKNAGLSDIYVIVPVGVEDLGEKWIGLGEADCVVTIQCLCSIPTPKKMIGDLYGYLKKGGIWIVYEHVKTHRGRAIAAYQSLIDIIWPHFLGGCSITRDSEKWLREAGVWTVVDLKQPPLEPSYQVIPHVMGVLTK